MSKKPVFDYTASHWVGIIALVSVFTTVAMAYGFSFHDEVSLAHWGVVACLVVVGTGLQVLREGGLKQRTIEAENESREAQEEYQRKQDSIAETQKSLERILKSMPPAHTLSNLVEKYRYIHFWWRTRKRVPATAPPEEKEKARKDIEEKFRLSLHSVARLYIDYDHLPLSTKCSAHFATYIPMSILENDKPLQDRVAGAIRFIEHPNDPLYGLEGVLHFTPELSSFAKPKMGEADRNAQDPSLNSEMFLPVPIEDDLETGLRKCLPIAPLAFQIGQLNVPNVAEMLSRDALSNQNINRRVIEEILTYIQQGVHGKMGSALGIRLLWDEPTGDDGKPIDPSEFFALGVLTIFTEAPASLEDGAFEAYIDLIRPILELQKDLLFARIDLLR